MNKLIIFEGPDRIGKSTQVKKLFQLMNMSENKIPTIMLHNAYFPIIQSTIDFKKEQIQKYYNYYENQMNVLCEGRDANWILDRSHLGEWVYGQLYRKYKSYDIFELDNFIQKYFDCYLIVMIDDSERLIEREDGNSFSQKDLGLKQKEIYLFKEVYYNSKITKKFLINNAEYRKEDTSIAIQDISNRINTFIFF